VRVVPGALVDPRLSAQERRELLLRQQGVPAERARALAAQPTRTTHREPDDEPSDPGEPVTYQDPRPMPAGSVDVPLHSMDDEICVDHFQFYLLDPQGSHKWPRPGTAPTPFLEAASSTVGVHSRATDHYAAVRLEAWTHEPPAPPEAWDVAREVTLVAPSGQVTLWQLMGGRSASDRDFTLGRPGRYRLRAHGRGRTAAQALGPVTWLHGVEQYLIQFWPILP